MTKEKLQRILESHRLWLDGGAGRRADLAGENLVGANMSGMDLKGADLADACLACARLSYANLSETDLSDADLSDADLSNSNLACANLSGADLSGTDLRRANLAGAGLRGANLAGADLSDADLAVADLRGANLLDADLAGADLAGADLAEVESNETTAFFALQCPEEGSFVGWKKCRDNVVVKLLIPEDAKRSSATSRKCRASKALVLEVIGAEKAMSSYDKSFTYEVGKEVVPDSYDDDRWKECSHGIHFFITRAEAENY